VLVWLVAACATDVPLDAEADQAAVERAEAHEDHPSGLVLDDLGRFELPVDPKHLSGWVTRWTRAREGGATCTVGGHVLVQHEGASVQALSSASGAELWSNPAWPEQDGFVECAALGGHAALLVGQRHVAVVDVRDGRELWRRSRQELVAARDGDEPWRRSEERWVEVFGRASPPRVIVRSCWEEAQRCELEALAPDGRTLFRHLGARGEALLVASDGLMRDDVASFSSPATVLLDPHDGRVLARAEGLPPDALLGELGVWWRLHAGAGLWVRPLRGGSGGLVRRFEQMQEPLGVEHGALVVLADGAIRAIDLASGVDRWSIALGERLTARAWFDDAPKLVRVDASRALLLLGAAPPAGVALLLDLEQGTVLQARLGAHLTEVVGDVALSPGGAVAIDESAPPVRSFESVREDVEHNLLVLRESLVEDLLEPASVGSWSTDDAERWLDGLITAGEPTAEARVLEALRDTYGRAPTQAVASERLYALSLLGERFPEHEAARLADETIAWTLALRDLPKVCGAAGDCRILLMSEADRTTAEAAIEAHELLSARVADPAPLDALEAATFGAEATPAGRCGEPRTDAEHAALALARRRAFPIGTVDADWCESEVALRPTWGTRRYSQGPEWDDAPTIVVELGRGCVRAPDTVLKQVRGRFRVVR
jgi:hypothetical protein